MKQVDNTMDYSSTMNTSDFKPKAFKESLATRLAEKGLIPDPLIRWGIRGLLRQRLDDEYVNDVELQWARFNELLEELQQSPIAVATDEANQQHYEVPADFYLQSLGKHLKYSSALWFEQTENLDQAERNMLDAYLERGLFSNGQRVLDMGCGWGSFSLYAAEKFPDSRITAVSNSTSQAQHIRQQCEQRGINNLEVITCDINEFEPDDRFDRIISIEMLEHIRNYQRIFQRISQWLKPDGCFFTHIFCHRYLMYPFETAGKDDWMGRYFFTGGMMPALQTFSYFQDHLAIDQQWAVNGQNYAKTANAWLANMDARRAQIIPVFKATYGEDHKIWWNRWRMFFMACAELFDYNQGNEWLVGHYRFRPK